MFMLNGKPLALDVAFTAGDINYPANWMRNASLSEKNAIGITEVSDPAWYDQLFYWGVGNPKTLADTNNYASYDKDGKGEGDVTSVTPGLKTNWIDQQKATAGSLLAKTDWMIIRKEETTAVVPSATTAYRGTVRTQCKKREDQITACDTTDKLATLIGENKLEAWPTE